MIFAEFGINMFVTTTECQYYAYLMPANKVIEILNICGGYLSNVWYNDKTYVKFSEKVVEIARIRPDFTLYVSVNISKMKIRRVPFDPLYYGSCLGHIFRQNSTTPPNFDILGLFVYFGISV